MNKSNVPIDFSAVFEGVDVCGIDGQSVGQVSCSKSITHCKQLKEKRNYLHNNR